MTPDTDEQLLARFNRGERGALGLLAARHEQALLGLARGLLRGREDLARDAVQESWVRVIKYWGSFRGGSSVKTWLYRIVINRCRDLRNDRAGEFGAACAGVGAGVVDGIAADEPGPDPQAEAESLGDRVRRAVEAMPAGSRLVLLLCYHRGLTHEQVAEVLDIPVGTLKSRLHGALQGLRAKLGDEVVP